MRINIAIDGPAAAGKSTIAKILAARLGYIHLDTGSMYRCIAYKATKMNISIDDEAKIAAFLPTTAIEFDPQGGIYLDGENVTEMIRQEKVSWLASSVSTLLSVRQDLVRRQQELAQRKGVIMDGRDIGTVVLPHAEVKIFLTASVKSRATRRYRDQKIKNPDVRLEDIEADIIRRDKQDTTRRYAPLRQANDAIVIDSTDMAIADVVEQILNIIKTRENEVDIDD